MERCKDLEFANGQIEYMASRSIGLPMFSRAPLIDFVQWEQEFGSLVQKKDAAQLRPFEETEWILRQVNKFGRDKEAMKEEWKQKLAGHWRRDQNGYKGATRLWLPAKEMEEKSHISYIKGGAKELSKPKKNPKEFEKEAFRRHAVEAGFDHGHAFFGGGSSFMDDEEEGNQSVPVASDPAKAGEHEPKVRSS